MLLISCTSITIYKAEESQTQDSEFNKQLKEVEIKNKN